MIDDKQIVLEPEVYVVSRPAVNGWEIRRYLDDHGFEGRKLHNDAGPAERLVELGGRLCYQSFDEGRDDLGDYLNNILESRHGSVLEHAVFGVLLAGISRSCSHELVRHRAGFGFSQVSQRYVSDRRIRFVLPPAYIGDEGLTAVWRNAMGMALTGYRTLTRDIPRFNRTAARKEVREAARSVLPNATETQVLVTGNVRAWRHFTEQRANRHADKEIRRLAAAVFAALSAEAGLLFRDYRGEELPDGSLELTTPWAKV